MGVALNLRGPGGPNLMDPGNRFCELWSFPKEESEIYQLLFTSSKNIDHSQSYHRLKVSAHV